MMKLSNFNVNYNNQLRLEKNFSKTNFCNKNTKTDFAKNEKEKPVTLKEAGSLFIGGAFNHLKNTALTLIKNPLKVAGLTIATSAGIAALPLMGISMAAGASALSLLYLSVSSVNLAKDLIKGFKDYKKENYENLRQDIKQTGADCLDIGLTLPFSKGATKLINRQIKYGKINLNKDLLKNLTTAKTFNDKIINLMKEQYILSFQQIVKEKGLKTIPDLQFVHLNKNMTPVGGWNSSGACVSIYENNIPFNLKNFGDIKERTTSIYLPYLKECFQKIKFNNLNPIVDIAKTCKDFSSMISKKFNIFFIDNVLSHELKHMDQYITIARTEGLGIDAISPMNRKFYKALIKEKGIIKAGSKEAQKAFEYVKARENYVKVNPKNFNEYIYSYPKYKASLLEREAFKVGDDYIRLKPKLHNNVIQELSLTENS